jgi:hypothetical protein
MKSIDIAGKTYTVQGELPNGVFYLDGPRGGSVLFAKPVFDQLSGANVYFFHKALGGSAIHEKSGLIASATRDQLAA